MNMQLKILNKEFFRRTKLGGDFYDLPAYQTQGSAAVDLYCTEDICVLPGEVKQIRTGIAIWIGSSEGSDNTHVVEDNVRVAGMILPRSGLGSEGLVLANTIGVIDADYQGELLINVWNRNGGSINPLNDAIDLEAGDRFAQLMFVHIVKARWSVVEDFSNSTGRSARGFGSTGV